MAVRTGRHSRSIADEAKQHPQSHQPPVVTNVTHFRLRRNHAVTPSADHAGRDGFLAEATGRRFDQEYDMSIKHNVAFFMAALVFGSASTVVAAGNGSSFRVAADASAKGTCVDTCGVAGAMSGENDAAEQTSRLSRQAPIGHRQPRAGDVPADTQLSPSEFEQRRLDQDLDKRLIICHGC